MLDARLFDEMADRLAALLPPAAADMKSEFENNLRALLQSTLAKMDVVSREDFDIQSTLLQKTALRVKELEQRITALEQKNS